MENIIKEKYISDYPIPISLQSSETIIEQMKNCVCKINLLNGVRGTGFFYRMPYDNYLLPVLITNNHVIDRNILNENGKILITINNKDIEIFLKDRKTYTNEDYDVTIIEIEENKDGINHYLDIDNDILKNKSKISFIKPSVYTIQYESNKNEVSVSYGIIRSRDEKSNYTFEHLCSTNNGSSGSPILNIETNKIIGIHKEAQQNKKTNRGTFLDDAINDCVIQMKKNELLKGYNEYNQYNNNDTIINLEDNLTGLNINYAFNNNIDQNNDQNINDPNHQVNSLNGLLNYNSEVTGLFNPYNNSFQYHNYPPIPIAIQPVNQSLNTSIYSKSEYLTQIKKYFFSKIGLTNNGQYFYMNANLQCLIHVSDLIDYYLDDYEKDFSKLKENNKKIKSQGNISKAFFELIKGVINYEEMSNDNAYSPDNFTKIIGFYNPQFRKIEPNSSKDFMLYLLQAIHEELNNFGEVPLIPKLKCENREKALSYFNDTYNAMNSSIISNIFYGVYEYEFKCNHCHYKFYDFQMFELLSFDLYYYNQRPFNIYKGFKDNRKDVLLRGDKRFNCNICFKNDVIRRRKIEKLPNKLLINLDYGKNRQYQPSKITFGELIDITEFVNSNQGSIYRIIGICTYLEQFGSDGYYICYCLDKVNDQWYKFNDSSCTKCNNSEIHNGNPYLLLYEKYELKESIS